LFNVKVSIEGRFVHRVFYKQVNNLKGIEKKRYNKVQKDTGHQEMDNGGMMYDVIVLGGGPGGYSCAIRCAQYGLKACLVEEKELGGVCLNKGCIPTKSLFSISEEIGNSRFSSIKKETSFEWGKILEEIKTDAVMRLRNGVRFLFKQNGVDFVQGKGIIAGENSIRVGEQTIEGKNIVLATGSVPRIPKILQDEKRTLTSDDLWSLENLPESIAIVGGGVIGCEFASILNRFGVKITLYEMAATLLPGRDVDVVTRLEGSLKKAGVQIFTGRKIESIEEIAEEKIIVSVGRGPNISAFENTGLDMENGGIRTNRRMETSTENIYAVGDVNGKFLYAYVATREGLIAADNISGGDSEIDYENIPETIFSHPEIGLCGLTEKQAVEKGIKIRVGKFPYTASGKALAEKHTEGFVKVVADAYNEEILGVHIIGKGATELVSFSTLAIKNRLKVSNLEKILYCHPTYAEGIMEAVEDINKRSINIPPHRKVME
jgi:dihydrolipoamide dehydrogenase